MTRTRTSVGSPGQQLRTRRRFGVRGTAAAIATSALAAAVLTAGTGTAQAAVDTALGYDPVADKGSLHHIAEVVGAHAAWSAGYTGRGVGIALIDTGVSPVPGLTSGNVVHGPDLSFDSQTPDLAHLDAYGHGTHLASIIAGRDAAGTPQSYADPARFTGIAPDSTLVNVKVGASDGSVDVTQVIAAIDWVVEHKADHNIRVINLSYGTDSVQDSAVDPLAFAVENAWKNGITVVVAGGNDGRETELLANPALDPHVLAVGANDTQGTVPAKDDTVPAFASRGTDKRHVDVVAPGVSVLGLRVPNGYADERNPQARVGDRFARASGTSQSAAVVSAEAALFLQRYPQATPDDVKAHFMKFAEAFPNAGQKYRGSGLAHIGIALSKSLSTGKPNGLPYSTGTGSLAAARGSMQVDDGYGPLTGDLDIFGRPFDAAAWARATSSGTAWVGGSWMGVQLTGDGWVSGAWPVTAWDRGNWNARMWRTADWEARMWRAGQWQVGEWNARMWRDMSWTARMWRGGFTSADWK